MQPTTLNLSSVEEFNKFLDTKQGGEDGTTASIVQSARFYAANDGLRPSMRGSKQNKGVAVTNYGGMIVNKFGIPASTIHGWGDVIAERYAQFDTHWDDTKEDFVKFIVAEQAQQLAEANAEAERDAQIGKPSEQFSKAGLNSSREIALLVANNGHVTRKAYLDLVEMRDNLNKTIVALDATQKVTV